MMENIRVREAHAGDVEDMTAFIFMHGPNQWNHLPEEDVGAHIAAIADGKTGAVLAEIEGRLAGFVTFTASRSMTRYQSRENIGHRHGYVCEAVVHRDHAGKGIGAQLLRRVVAALAANGHTEIYIERHEENLASAGMMRKAGFIEIDTFDDPVRRTSGSRRTTVCRLMTKG
jgi:ribosomal protein S18 acetylase RimI-like enzyme